MAIFSIFICGYFLCVLYISLSNISISDGNTVKIHIKLINTPLDKTIPKSVPILKLINKRAKSPTMVVNELPIMDGNDFFIASFIEVKLFLLFSFSSR